MKGSRFSEEQVIAIPKEQESCVSACKFAPVRRGIGVQFRPP